MEPKNFLSPLASSNIYVNRNTVPNVPRLCPQEIQQHLPQLNQSQNQHQNQHRNRNNSPQQRHPVARPYTGPGSIPMPTDPETGSTMLRKLKLPLFINFINEG